MLCVFGAQRVSRLQLQVTVRACSDTSDALAAELGQQVAKVGDLCSVLKPLASGSSPPSVQVMYFGAAALTQGLPSPPDTSALHLVCAVACVL